LWPKSYFTSLYNATKWPEATLHHIRDPSHVKGILVDHAASFEKAPLSQAFLAPVLGSGILTAQGERWSSQRRIAAPALKKGTLERLAPFINSAARDLCSRLSSRKGDGECLMFPELSRFAFEVINKLLFGDSRASLSHGVVAAAFSTYLEALGEDSEAAHRAVGALQEACSAAMAQRGADAAKSDDLLSHLERSSCSHGGPLTHEEVRDNIITFILAGHETTAVAAAWTLYLLALNPDVQSAAFDEVISVAADGDFSIQNTADMALLRRVISESLRLYPPVASTWRIALQDIELDGCTLLKGSVANILFYPLHRHEALWTDPNRFCPARFLSGEAASRHKYAFTPFSVGPRVCIGAHLATLELLVLVAHVLRNFVLLPSKTSDARPIVRITLRPSDEMPLVLKRREAQ
jgi:cytochrome P450